MPDQVRTLAYEHPEHGRVLEVRLEGTVDPERMQRGIGELKQEAAHQSPDWLVLNLLGFGTYFDSAAIALLVYGYKIMREAGRGARTRFLATGSTAEEFQRILKVVGLDQILGPYLYEDLESALGEGPPPSTEPKA